MAFTTPTLAQLVERISDDLDSQFPSGSARLPGLKWALARVTAGAAYTLHRFGLDISAQILPTTARGVWLDMHATIRGLSRRAAVRASGPAQMTGTGTVPVFTELARQDGARYRTLAELTLSGSPANVTVQALNGGLAGNTDATVPLSLVSPIFGVSSAAVVQAPGITGGAEQEGDQSLRDRILLRWRNAPAGGTMSDWQTWALAVDGVARAWVDSPTAGTVRVVPAGDDPDDPIPAAGVISALSAYLETFRPVTATLAVITPTAYEVDFTIEVSPDTSAVRAAVAAELKDLLAREGQPGGTIKNSRIREAISGATGEEWHVLSSVDGGAATADVTVGATQLAILGDITWV